MHILAQIYFSYKLSHYTWHSDLNLVYINKCSESKCSYLHIIDFTHIRSSQKELYKISSSCCNCQSTQGHCGLRIAETDATCEVLLMFENEKKLNCSSRSVISCKKPRTHLIFKAGSECLEGKMLLMFSSSGTEFIHSCHWSEVRLWTASSLRIWIYSLLHDRDPERRQHQHMMVTTTTARLLFHNTCSERRGLMFSSWLEWVNQISWRKKWLDKAEYMCLWMW